MTEAAVEDMRARYELGCLVNRLRHGLADQVKNRALAKLAGMFRLGPATLWQYARVTRAIGAEEFERYLMLRGPHAVRPALRYGTRSARGSPPPNGVMIEIPMHDSSGSLTINTVPTDQTPHGICVTNEVGGTFGGCNGGCPATDVCYDIGVSGGAAQAAGNFNATSQVFVVVDNGIVARGINAVEACTANSNPHSWVDFSDSRGTYYCGDGNDLGATGTSYEGAHLTSNEPAPELSTACATCASLGATCGTYQDGCGGANPEVITCGVCSAGDFCSSRTLRCGSSPVPALSRGMLWLLGLTLAGAGVLVLRGQRRSAV